MFNHSTFFIGLDLGDKHSHLCVLDQDGQMIEETRLPNQSADGSRVNGLRSEANRSAVATSTLDKLSLLMEVVRRNH